MKGVVPTGGGAIRLTFARIVIRSYYILGRHKNEQTKPDIVYSDVGISHSTCGIHGPRFREPTYE